MWVEGFRKVPQREREVGCQGTVSMQAVLQRLVEDGVEDQRSQKLSRGLPTAQLSTTEKQTHELN